MSYEDCDTMSGAPLLLEARAASPVAGKLTAESPPPQPRRPRGMLPAPPSARQTRPQTKPFQPRVSTANHMAALTQRGRAVARRTLQASASEGA